MGKSSGGAVVMSTVASVIITLGPGVLSKLGVTTGVMLTIKPRPYSGSRGVGIGNLTSG